MGKLATRDLYARNIYLLGTAEFGPVNSPILAKSMSHVKSIFGEIGSLIEAYSMIEDSDVPCNVYLVKTSGSHAELYLNVIKENGEIIKDGFFIKSRHANESSNDINMYLDDNIISFMYPEELGGNILTYELSKYNTLHELASAINEDTKLMKGEVFCSAFCEHHISCQFTLAPVNPTNLKLTGGSSGLNYNKNMMYNSLGVTYSVLEGRPTDIVVPLDCYFDDTMTDNLELLDEMPFDKDYITLKQNGEYVSFYKQLIDFCKLQMRSAIITHGVMGMSVASRSEDSDTLLKKLDIFNEINKTNGYYSKYEYMVSVVSSNAYAMYGTLVTNLYIAYAVLLASTMISETTTNKKLPSSFILHDIYEQDVLNEISDKNFICFRNSPLTRNIHVVNGVTRSTNPQLKYLCNVRAIQVVMKAIRGNLSKYIGMNIESVIESGDINNDLQEIISELSSLGLIEGCSCASVLKKDESNLMLDISFSTRYMTEEIKSYSGLSAIGETKYGVQ